MIRICPAEEIPKGGVIRADVDGTEIAVVKSEGQFFAVRDECSHAQIQLSEGDVGECQIECWLHGSCFDLRSGKPTGPPANKPVPVYRVKIDGDDVLVSLSKES